MLIRHSLAVATASGHPLGAGQVAFASAAFPTRCIDEARRMSCRSLPRTGSALGLVRRI